MKRSFINLILAPLMLVLFSCQTGYKYDTVEGDPLQTRIYTLNNGLKVYLSVNKEKPRIQANIAVKVGGKNDPDETTGLAHYFEHLMFKGTEKFGTMDFQKEKPLLDQIEELFEVYRKTTDPAERQRIYRKIDSVSYEASRFAIPNEYDKLMAAIGASGTNAYTSMDMTVYVEDIPSNEVENWAKIQADRFQNPVIRGFHTELETVYEEKNMSLTNDGRKVYEKLMAELFSKHPYGTHTVLGTQEHLKNPSITNIKNYHKTWYVPNNMAICMAGDFNPDEVITIIDRYFGGMEPNRNLPQLEFEPETPITEPVKTVVYGPEAESITLGWRLPGILDKDFPVMYLLGKIFYNGKAGILDLNINQKQQVLGASAYMSSMPDYGIFMMAAYPKAGQTLDQVKDILLAEVDKLKRGEFDDQLIRSTINNEKRVEQSEMEKNEDIADKFVKAFIYGTSWEDEVHFVDRLNQVTKEDIIAFANTHLHNNYAVIYKETGADPEVTEMEKPQITPIVMNRDASSDFLKEIQNTQVQPIEPVFLDYSTDLNKFTVKSDLPVLYKQNTTNDLFSLTFLFETGTNDDKLLGTAAQYLQYLGTDAHSAEKIKEQFYHLACNYNISAGAEQLTIGLSGLSENMDKALELLESLLAQAKPDARVLENMKSDILKGRMDIKKNQMENFRRLMSYAYYGKKSPYLNIMSERELKSLTPEDLLAKMRGLNNYEHTVLYYGPMTREQLTQSINTLHRLPEKLQPVVSRKQEYLPTPSNKVLIAPYDAQQVYMCSYSNRGEKFTPQSFPLVTMYNNYFGGGMNSIVFQELRESRGLAYSASARFNQPSRLEIPYVYFTFIATQNDKMFDALKAFDEIINTMPESENAFRIARESLLTNLRTERITKSAILWSYLSSQKLGLDTDRRKILFDSLQTMTLEHLKRFQEEWVKDRAFTYSILGNERNLDIKGLEEYGPVTRLSTKDIFGY